MLPRRTVELRLAVTVIATAVAFTATVLVWRVVYDDDPWSMALLSLPSVPRMQGLAAFDFYQWLWLVVRVAVMAMLAGAVVRWVTGWRAASRWMALALPLLVCVLAAGIYVPLWGLSERRIDRLAGTVEEPVLAVRGLAVSVGVTFVLAAVLIVVTWRRRAPESVRQVALVLPGILAGILLNIFILLLTFPASNRWIPSGWQNADRLLPFRACRGAMLWLRPDPGDSWVRPVGRIDDVWQRFADPRHPGGETWAVSVEGEWREEYVWLSRAEAGTLGVRGDDPALGRCDSRARLERVLPESWHRVGLD